jgi:predicted ester cyclase
MPKLFHVSPRKQQLNYEDVVHRLVADKPRCASPRYDIRDIVAEADKFAIRLLFGGNRTIRAIDFCGGELFLSPEGRQSF